MNRESFWADSINSYSFGKKWACILNINDPQFTLLHYYICCGICKKSTQSIADDFKKTTSAIRKARRILVDKGYITHKYSGFICITEVNYDVIKQRVEQFEIQDKKEKELKEEEKLKKLKTMEPRKRGEEPSKEEEQDNSSAQPPYGKDSIPVPERITACTGKDSIPVLEKIPPIKNLSKNKTKEQGKELDKIGPSNQSAPVPSYVFNFVEKWNRKAQLYNISIHSEITDEFCRNIHSRGLSDDHLRDKFLTEFFGSTYLVNSHPDKKYTLTLSKAISSHKQFTNIVDGKYREYVRKNKEEMRIDNYLKTIDQDIEKRYGGKNVTV